MRTVPAVGLTKPESTLISVVLPAPFGPTSPVTGSGRFAVSALRPRTPPNITVRSSISIMTVPLPRELAQRAECVRDLAGHALRRGDQRVQQAGAEHHGRDVAVDVEIVKQRGEGAQQKSCEQRARPTIGAADDRQREQP